MQVDRLRNEIAMYVNIIKAIDDQIESLKNDREKFIEKLVEIIY